jgi:hypothetical protein
VFISTYPECRPGCRQDDFLISLENKYHFDLSQCTPIIITLSFNQKDNNPATLKNKTTLAEKSRGGKI